MRTVSIVEHPLDERDTTHDFSRFDWNAVHPLLPAEELDERDLFSMRATTPMERAWRRMEEAIASPMATRDPDRPIGIFKRDLRFLGPAQLQEFNQHDAAIALASLEVLRCRVANERPDRATLAQHYRQNGALAVQLAGSLQERYRMITSPEARQNDLGIAAFRGALAKSLVLTLLAKAGVSAVPASEREQHSSWIEYNHNIVVDREGNGQYMPLSVGNKHRKGRVHTDICHFNATAALSSDAVAFVDRSIRGHARERSLQRLQVSSRARALEAITWLVAPDIADQSGHQTPESKIAKALGEHILLRMSGYSAFTKSAPNA